MVVIPMPDRISNLAAHDDLQVEWFAKLQQIIFTGTKNADKFSIIRIFSNQIYL